MKKTFYISLVFFSFLSSKAAFSKEVVDKIAASVNDEVVLLSEFNNVPKRLEKQGAIDETLLLGESLENLKKDKKAQINFLIREKLVDSEVKRLGMSASEEQVNSEFFAVAKKVQMTPAEFKNYLSAQGYTLDEYKSVLKGRIERQIFFEREIVNKLRITDEDAYGVYKTKFPDSRSSVGEFSVAQIFFSNKKGGVDAAAERAKAALARLSSGGESFENLANQLDETPGANKDGFLGNFKSGEFIPEIERAIADMSVNSASGVLRGPNGFHIIKLIDKKIVPDPNFLRVKDAIKASLVQQNFERQLKNWFELKKLQANIKIYDGTL